MSDAGIKLFIKQTRDPILSSGQALRKAFVSEFYNHNNGYALDSYVADRIPLFYRTVSQLAAALEGGHMLSAIRDTLARIPTSASFQESHFGEVLSSLFAEGTLDLIRVYSKLTLLSAENANAYKMDLVLYEPNSDPAKFLFGEVKISTKDKAAASLSGHHKSAYPSLFNSLNAYSQEDLQFDLTAARDRMADVPEPHRASIRAALLPYAARKVEYSGFIVIDIETYVQKDAEMLATRSCDKDFCVDVLCCENLKSVIAGVFARLEAVKGACSS